MGAVEEMVCVWMLQRGIVVVVVSTHSLDLCLWGSDPKLFNYSLKGQVLEEVMDAKYLGVTLSNDLELLLLLFALGHGSSQSRFSSSR